MLKKMLGLLLVATSINAASLKCDTAADVEISLETSAEGEMGLDASAEGEMGSEWKNTYSHQRVRNPRLKSGGVNGKKVPKMAIPPPMPMMMMPPPMMGPPAYGPPAYGPPAF